MRFTSQRQPHNSDSRCPTLTQTRLLSGMMRTATNRSRRRSSDCTRTAESCALWRQKFRIVR